VGSTFFSTVTALFRSFPARILSRTGDAAGGREKEDMTEIKKFWYQKVRNGYQFLKKLYEKVKKSQIEKTYKNGVKINEISIIYTHLQFNDKIVLLVDSKCTLLLNTYIIDQ
jgi:hypothetical protein